MTSDAPDPEEIEFVLTKQNDVTMKDFEEASVRELEAGAEQLTLKLTVSQAQRWVDTLAARLHEWREQAATDMDDVDEVFLVQTIHADTGQVIKTHCAAFTRRAAAKRANELRYENRNFGEEVTVNTLPFVTDDEQ